MSEDDLRRPKITYEEQLGALLPGDYSGIVLRIEGRTAGADEIEAESTGGCASRELRESGGNYTS